MNKSGQISPFAVNRMIVSAFFGKAGMERTARMLGSRNEVVRIILRIDLSILLVYRIKVIENILQVDLSILLV